jgi:drug/metabolite transporter (DMT)-like permease
MDFLRVPVTALAGWLIYSEAIGLSLVAGAGLILAANVLNLRGPDTTVLGGLPGPAAEDERTK